MARDRQIKDKVQRLIKQSVAEKPPNTLPPDPQPSDKPPKKPAWLTVIAFALGGVIGFGGGFVKFADSHIIDNLSVRIASYEYQLKELEQSKIETNQENSIAIFSLVQSEIEGPCRKNQTCRGTYKLKRTKLGLACQAPKAQPYIIDAAGKAVASQWVNFTPVRVGDEWTTIGFSFLVPHPVDAGVAKFYANLEYSCERNGREVTAKEMTPYLMFRVKE